MRLEAFTVRKYTTAEGEEKSAWTRIGVAFPHNNGQGYSVSLDAMPAPTIKNGSAKYEIVLRPPMEKDGRGYEQRREAKAPTRDDSDIPW